MCRFYNLLIALHCAIYLLPLAQVILSIFAQFCSDHIKSHIFVVLLQPMIYHRLYTVTLISSVLTQ